MSDPDISKKRQFIKQFIRLYESFPCLWNLKSHEYHNRELRTKAYKILVKKMQEIQPGADRMTVVKKINALRSNLRKEKRKILESIKLGRVIKPKLWYHHHFDFLNGIRRRPEIESESVDNIKIQGRTSAEQIKIEYRTSDPLEYSADYTDESNLEEDYSVQNLAAKEPCQTTYETENLQAPHPMIDSTFKPVTESHRRLEQDRHDVFGKNVAMKLRHISSINDAQRIMAEKIINEALSMAEMELLTMENCKARI